MTISTHNQEPLHIAILVSTSLAWGRHVVNGILNYSNEVGPWQIWIRPSSTSDTVNQLPEGVEFDGVIGRISDPNFVDQLSQRHLPVVDVNDMPLEESQFPCVRTDDREGARMAAAHLLDKGLRHIAFIGSNVSTSSDLYEDYFREALAEHGLPLHTFPIYPDYNPERHEETIAWLEILPKPVGILTWGVNNGRNLVDCCREAGFTIPHDVSVLSGGYDELLSRVCFPPLSGILTPTEQIGYKAARLLHRMIQGEQVPDGITEIAPLGIAEHLSTDTLAVEDERLTKAIQYIRDHAFEQISMKDILTEVPMGQRTLERKFLQQFGRSPTDEVRRLRINKARQLLAGSDLPMQLIAEACGYATYNYLTHVFKKHTGLSPRDYRQQYRN